MLGSGIKVLVPTNQLGLAKQIAKIDDGILKCPNCESTSLKNEIERTNSKLRLFLIALFVAPIGNLINNYECEDCGHKFKK